MIGPGDPKLRPATAADHPAIVAIGAANDEPLELPAGSSADYLAHLAARGQMLVAEVAGTVAAFAAAIDLPDGSRHLTDLFVAPNHHGGGLGRRLLAAVLEGSTSRTTFASTDPRALPLYARAGMGAHWPLLYLEFDVTAIERLDEMTGATPMAERVEGPAAAAAEADLSGADRSPDYPIWIGRAGSVALVVRDAGEQVAVGLAGSTEVPGRVRLLRAVQRPAADPAALVALVLAMCGQRAGGRRLPVPSSAEVAIPGPHPALARLLEAGARITGRDTFMASDPGLVDPRSTLPDPAMR